MSNLGKKKIVLVMNNFLVGGAEGLLYDLLAHLDLAKFDLTIITILGSGPWETKFSDLGIPIYFAGPKKNYSRGWLFKLLWLVSLPILLWRVWHWLKKCAPDVVMTCLYQADVIGLPISYYLGIKQRVFIQQDMLQLSQFKRLVKSYIALRLATHVVAVSQAVKDFLITYFRVSPDRIDIIYNGIDMQQFSTGEKSVDPSHLVLGMIGRLEPIKGPEIFTQSLQILKTKFGLTPLSYLGGEGSLRPELMNYATEAQLSHLTLDGEIRDVPAWLRKIDILVVPSLSEGFGLVILEGLAANKLVVVSDLPATRELVTDGINGYLFPVGDVVALSHILQRLLTDKDSFIQLKQQLEEWRQQHLLQYDINHITEQYEQLLG